MAISKFSRGCPADQRQRRAASFFRANLGSEGREGATVTASCSLPAHPIFSFHCQQPPPSSKYTLQASTSATGAMCACFAALPFHPPLIVCHHMSERLNIRPKQSVYQLNIFCRDLCFCNTTSTIKPFKPSKWAKHLQNTSRSVSSVQTSSDEGSYHHLWTATGTLFVLQRVVWWLHLKHAICFTF